jgi:hypothetical protein
MDVGREKRDPVAVLDAARLERQSESPHPVPNVCPGEATLTFDDRDPAREDERGAFEERERRQRRVRDIVHESGNALGPRC